MKRNLKQRQHRGGIVLGTVVVLGVAAIYLAARGGLPWTGDRARTPASPALPFTAGGLPVAGSNPATDARTAPGAPGTAAASRASLDQSSLPGGAAPQPWQYDAPRNRFWHPEHGHWHDGPPPDPSQPVAAAALPTISGASPDQSTLPGDATPQPWQYDAPRNRFWHPEHGHWHAGQPPDPSQRGAVPSPAASGQSQDQSPLPGGATPQPWQYDAPRGRFWHPVHGHWHVGPPPDPGQRVAAKVAPPPDGGADQSPLFGGVAPSPNYYDTIKNRYWVAEHSHWHAGRPPQTATGATGSTAGEPASPEPPSVPAPPESPPTPADPR